MTDLIWLIAVAYLSIVAGCIYCVLKYAGIDAREEGINWLLGDRLERLTWALSVRRRKRRGRRRRQPHNRRKEV